MSIFLVGMAFVALVLIMSALWLYQKKTSNAGWVDVGWAWGTGLAGVFLTMTAEASLSSRVLVSLMISIWSLRLGYHIFSRVRSGPEENRYRMLRNYWSSGTQWKFFLFFQGQALLALLFGALVAVSASSRIGLGWQEGLALLIWIIAVVGEATADAQLKEFKALGCPDVSVCAHGLWRYSRHPNYFFEWVHWWGYVVMAWGSPEFIWTLLAPVLMLIFLYRITGIPATEKQSLKSRGEAYARYQQTTPAFFPWFPKREVQPCNS